MQRQHGIVATGHLEDGGAAQEGQGPSRYGGGLTAHLGEPALPPPASPPRGRGRGDGTRLPYQRPRGGGVRP